MRSPPTAKPRSVAPSTPANPPRKGWSRSSTRSMPSARPARPTSPARSTRAGSPLPTPVRRWRHLGRHHGPPGPAAAARRHRGGHGRHRGGLQGRPADPLAGATSPRSSRCSTRMPRLVRLGDPAVQHHHLDGPADAQHAAVLRPVRARGHRRADPRQDRRLEAEGDVDGRPAAARLRRRRIASWSSTRPRRPRSATSSDATPSCARSARCSRSWPATGSSARLGSIASAEPAAASRWRAVRST